MPVNCIRHIRHVNRLLYSVCLMKLIRVLPSPSLYVLCTLADGFSQTYQTIKVHYKPGGASEWH